MSRLDRFLVSNKYCEWWPNCIQVAYQRGLSDHVPVMLYVDDANWGPDRFECLNVGLIILVMQILSVQLGLILIVKDGAVCAKTEAENDKS